MLSVEVPFVLNEVESSFLYDISDIVSFRYV